MTDLSRKPFLNKNWNWDRKQLYRIDFVVCNWSGWYLLYVLQLSYKVLSSKLELLIPKCLTVVEIFHVIAKQFINWNTLFQREPLSMKMNLSLLLPSWTHLEKLKYRIWNAYMTVQLYWSSQMMFSVHLENSNRNKLWPWVFLRSCLRLIPNIMNQVLIHIVKLHK